MKTKKQWQPQIDEIQMSNFPKRELARSEPTFQQVPQSIKQVVLRLLRDCKSHKKNKQKQETSIFYIDPMTFQIGMWNLLVILGVYILEIQISFTLAFGPHFWTNQQAQTFYFAMYSGLLIMLGVDMMVNFYKGYYAFGYGKVIDDKTKIMKNYLKSYFLIDVLTIGLLMIPIFHSGYVLNFLQLLPMGLLFTKKLKCQSQIIRSLQYYRNLRYAFTLVMLGCDVMMIGNFGACIFLGLDLMLWRIQFFGNNPQYYWLSNNSSYSTNLIDGPWIVQYVFAQSFSTGTLSTLAPGPFGKNPIQISYELFVMIFFMILASYVGEVLVSILYSQEEIRIFHENNIQKFDHFMTLKSVANKIKKRVQNFFELIWEFQIKINAEKQQKIIQGIPISLRQDLIIQMGFAKQISFINFFKNSVAIQKFISFKISSIVVDPDTTIFQVGAPVDAVGEGHIYFIKNGLAKFYYPSFQRRRNLISLSNLQRILGQYQFVTGLSFPFDCSSVDLCILQRIRWHDMNNIIRIMNLTQQLHMLKIKFIMRQDLAALTRNCIICDEEHREDICHWIWIKQKILKQLKQQDDILGKFTKDVERKKYTRKSIQSMKRKKQVKIVRKNTMLKSYQIRGLGLKQQMIAETEADQIENYISYYPDFNIIL